MSRAIKRNATMSAAERIVVIAMGNRFRGDDGIGPVVAERLQKKLAGRPAHCTIVAGRDDAMALVSAWEGAALAVVIDAAVSGATPGTIRRLTADVQPLPADLARCSSHGLGLAEAVELGRVLERVPQRLVIYAVEAATMETGVGLSPQVANAVDELVRQVDAEITSLANSSQIDA
jgi:hydrogenase maturation protease